MQLPELEYTIHARERMTEQGIRIEWVERAVTDPVRRMPDPIDPEIERFYGQVPDRDAYFRVAVNTQLAPWRVVTVHFDWRMRGYR